MHHWHLIPLIKYTQITLCQLPQGYSDGLLINQRGGQETGHHVFISKASQEVDLICLRPAGIALESRSLYKWEHAIPKLQPWRPLGRAFCVCEVRAIWFYEMQCPLQANTVGKGWGAELALLSIWGAVCVGSLECSLRNLPSQPGSWPL